MIPISISNNKLCIPTTYDYILRSQIVTPKLSTVILKNYFQSSIIILYNL